MTENYVAHSCTNEVISSKSASANRFVALITNFTTNDVPKNPHNTPSTLPIPITNNPCDLSQLASQVSNKSLPTQTSKLSVTANTTTTLNPKPTTTTNTINLLDLWHKRLGRPSLKITKTILTKHNIPFSQTTSILTFCESCTINNSPAPLPTVPN
ncbi:hypothetical protein AHAS_Ahas19G0248600 [Arachis hypogaea]